MIAKEGNRAVCKHRFVLEAVDPQTECVIQTVGFGVDDLSELCSIVDVDVDSLVRLAHELKSEVVESIKQRFKINFNSGGLFARLRPWTLIHDLPYEVHTNRELVLMLNGIKPLAHFYGQYPSHPDLEEIPERLFDPYVEANRFLKREYVVPTGQGDVLAIRHVMYALPNQEWRINAMILLLDTAAKSGWSEGLERMQGALLGYEAWQNDIFIERMYKTKCLR